jgi:hypothetical protein
MRRIGVLLLLLAASCGGGREGPRLVLDVPEGSIEFGPMRPGEVRERVVSFRNEGTAALVVGDLSSDCACARASWVGDRREFAPGESGELRIAMDARGLAGPLTKRLVVRSNDAERPVGVWTVRAEVLPGIVLSGHRLDFGRRKPGEAATASVELRSPKDLSEWTVVEVLGSALGPDGRRLSYAFDLRPIEDPRYRAVLLTVAHPPREPGTYDDALTVWTTHPDQKSFPLAAHLEVAP